MFSVTLKSSQLQSCISLICQNVPGCEEGTNCILQMVLQNFFDFWQNGILQWTHCHQTFSKYLFSHGMSLHYSNLLINRLGHLWSSSEHWQRQDTLVNEVEKRSFISMGLKVGAKMRFPVILWPVRPDLLPWNAW